MTDLRFGAVLALFLWAALTLDAAPAAEPARGPLRVSEANPRYFADPSGRLVFLTGSHTWNNLADMGRNDPPETFDFEAYLGILEKHGHNFIRLWAWDSTTWDTQANGSLGKEFIHHVAPLPWVRTGPGTALDRRPKFDLASFDSSYFERLRDRVKKAGERGIYVSVMLFEGWGLMHGNQGRAAQEGWAWRSHPFHPANNINGFAVEGSTEVVGRVHRLNQPAVNRFQEAYIRRVVDTVNEFDNVLFEVINEGGEREWDRWVIKTIRDQERKRPRQHPIGLTGHGAERLESMLDSDAEWLSPGRADGFAEEPPVWDASKGKVSILDTDHIWGVGGTVDWVWKSFLRGHNPIFMDPYDGSVLGSAKKPDWEPLRRAMGDARRFAIRINLAAMHPDADLASTGYCLAQAGHEYVVLVPAGGAVSVDLTGAKVSLAVEWFDPHRRTTVATADAIGGETRRFEAPFSGPAVLYLKAKQP